MTRSECHIANGEEIKLSDYEIMYYQLVTKVADALKLLSIAKRQGEPLTEQKADTQILPNHIRRNTNKDEK